MRDAVAEQQKARWLALSEEWLGPLMLKYWNITYHWFEEPLDKRPPAERIGPTGSICETKDGIPAHVFVQWDYMCADVEVDLRILSNMTEQEVERLFLHEMLHIILGGLSLMRTNKEAYKHLEEAAATWMAKVLMDLSRSRDPEETEVPTVDCPVNGVLALSITETVVQGSANEG